MQRKQILNKVLNFFKEKGVLAEEWDENNPAIEKIRYLEAGWLDSFDLIDFIMYLESEFNIEFSPEELHTDRFRSIGGVVDTILEKLSSRN
jgi:acyl carrier protein